MLRQRSRWAFRWAPSTVDRQEQTHWLWGLLTIELLSGQPVWSQGAARCTGCTSVPGCIVQLRPARPSVSRYDFSTCWLSVCGGSLVVIFHCRCEHWTLRYGKAGGCLQSWSPPYPTALCNSSHPAAATFVGSHLSVLTCQHEAASHVQCPGGRGDQVRQASLHKQPDAIIGRVHPGRYSRLQSTGGIQLYVRCVGSVLGWQLDVVRQVPGDLRRRQSGVAL
jgi:hypothetical protein